jgi:hypothetical protein
VSHSPSFGAAGGPPAEAAGAALAEGAALAADAALDAVSLGAGALDAVAEGAALAG